MNKLRKLNAITSKKRTTELVTASPLEVEFSLFSCDALFFGDSITADGSFDAYFPDLRVVNLGVYGDTIDDLLRRVPAVKAEKPAKIFLLGGINSLAFRGPEACQSEYADLVAALRAACPRAALCLQTVLPVAEDPSFPLDSTNDEVRCFNDGLKALAAAQGLVCVDLWALYEKDGALNPALTRDGVHLNYTAYGPWAEAVRPYLYP